MLRKCCAHCPGSVTRTGEPIREHTCAAPGYVSGSLRVASLSGGGCRLAGPRSRSAGKQREELEAAAKQPPGNTAAATCYERFATAKKFHAENLQHQPLPDRVDDAIFTAGRAAVEDCMCDAVKRCQKIVPRRQLCRKKELSRVHKYAPALGCKKPMTYMDLAICWETPVDATYEPRRPVHIDGSDGGPAPAIFTLVQHGESQVDVRDGCIPGQNGQEEQRADGCCCEHEEGCDKCQNGQQNGDVEDKEELCRHLNSLRIGDSPKSIGAGARHRRAQFMRHCEACGKRERKPTHGRAAVRSASCLQKSGCAVVQRRNNGLPSGGKCHVPRPRTPYARRSFCIDTLAPPFSIVNGCRDADYPEHWRLTSIYQQSYRNPRKMREGRTLLNYDRSYV